MDKELIWCLQQGPTTVKELARLTGKSTSGIYKALKDAPGVDKIESLGKEPTQFFIATTVEEPAVVNTPKANEPVSVSVSDKRGRKATGTGKKLFPSEMLLGGNDSPLTYQNPRRNGSHGYRSLQIIIDSPGITTGDYLVKGGRLNDLRWDIAHGNVKMED